MKKLVALVFGAVLAMLCLSGALAEEKTISPIADDRSNFVDIVILMDHSMSMETNDSRNYRLAAAAMITAMVDMNGSRVAFVPFNNGIAQENTFVDVSRIQSREALMETIAGYEREPVKAGTDTGEALAYAYNLLQSRSDEEKRKNAPMIILLTDGQNALRKNGGNKVIEKPCYVWDAQTGLYGKTTDADVFMDYSMDSGDSLEQNVVARAQQEGIAIYTLALYGANRSFIPKLEDMAQRTGGTCLSVNARADADKLPLFFADLFANRIGSVRETLEVRQTEDGYCEIEIPILNQSVVEANVYIPGMTVERDTVELYDADGRRRTADDEDVYCLESGNRFMLYKIRAHEPTGRWRLRFKLRSGVKLSDVTFNLLYSYDLTLKTAINGSGDKVCVNKGDTLSVRTQFYDNATGSASADQNLYARRDRQEDNIVATYEIVDSERRAIAGAAALSGTLEVNESGSAFVGEIDLSQTGLKSGSYYLKIVAEGLGLRRENNAVLELVNNAPALTGSAAYGLDVEKGKDDADNPTYRIQDMEMDLLRYVKDPDGDEIVFGNLALRSGEDVVGLRLQDHMLRGSTIRQADGHFAHGQGVYALEAFDQDDGMLEVLVEVNVTSGYADAKAYAYVADMQDAAGNPLPASGAGKNETVVFSMTPVHTNTGAPGSVEWLEGRITIVDDADGTVLQRLDMAHDGTRALVAQVDTPNAACSWTADIEYLYNDEAIAGERIALTVGNAAPYLDAARVTLADEITFNALPGFLAFLDTPTAEQERTLDLNACFVDADNETGLTFALDPAYTDDTVLKAEIVEGGTLRLTPLQGGTTQVHVTATDGDGASASYTYDARVIDLHTRWLIRLLMCVLAVVLLALVIRLIRYALAPAFSREAELLVKERSAITGYKYRFDNKPSLKRPVRLSDVVVAESCKKVGIPHTELAKIELLPTKDADTLVVRMAKPVNGLHILLDGNNAAELKVKKPLTLKANHDLVVQSVNDAGDCIRITPSVKAKAAGSMRRKPFTGESKPVNPFGTGSAPANKSASPFGTGSAPADKSASPFGAGNASAEKPGNPFEKN